MIIIGNILRAMYLFQNFISKLAEERLKFSFENAIRKDKYNNG